MSDKFIFKKVTGVSKSMEGQLNDLAVNYLDVTIQAYTRNGNQDHVLCKCLLTKEQIEENKKAIEDAKVLAIENKKKEVEAKKAKALADVELAKAKLDALDKSKDKK